MKTNNVRLLLVVAMLQLTVSDLFSQAPQGINYQAVARNAAGNVLVNQTITLRLTVEQGSAGTPLYVEVDTVTTNQFDLFTLKLGMQNAVSGTFSSIAWSSGNKWVKVEMDPNDKAKVLKPAQILNYSNCKRNVLHR